MEGAGQHNGTEPTLIQISCRRRNQRDVTVWKIGDVIVSVTSPDSCPEIVSETTLFVFSGYESGGTGRADIQIPA